MTPRYYIHRRDLLDQLIPGQHLQYPTENKKSNLEDYL